LKTTNSLDEVRIQIGRKGEMLFEEGGKRIEALAQEHVQLESPLTVLRDEVKGGADQLAALEDKISAISGEITERSKEIEELKKKLDETAVPNLVENLEKLRIEIGRQSRKYD
jgi:chromosome segregation protein